MVTLQTQLIAIRSAFARIYQRCDYENAQAARLRERMTDIADQKTMHVKAQALIDKTIEVISANGIGRIEDSVTNGLQLVMANKAFSFKVLKKEGARGNSYAFEVHQGEIHGPIHETFGGTLSNLIALLLRVMMIKRFGLAKFLVVDEAFNHISSDRLPKTSELLKTLASSGGYTIIAITHQPILAYAADVVYRGIPGSKDGDPSTLIRLSQRELAELNFDQFREAA